MVEAYTPTEFQQSLKALQSRFVKMFTNKEMTDTVLLVNETHKYSCHRAILMSASDYFKAMFTTNFSESTSGQVLLQLNDFDAKAFETTLLYCYSGTILLIPTIYS